MRTTLEQETPFLTVDLDAVERNVTRMQRYCDGHGLSLRAHVKTHKLGPIVERQIALGIKKFKSATIAEAEMCAQAGAPDQGRVAVQESTAGRRHGRTRRSCRAVV